MEVAIFFGVLGLEYSSEARAGPGWGVLEETLNAYPELVGYGRTAAAGGMELECDGQ